MPAGSLVRAVNGSRQGLLSIVLANPYIWGMVTFHSHTCDRCKANNPISFEVEPPEAWRTVVLNRWRKLCPSCFDTEAEKAGVAYKFARLEGLSWSSRPVPRSGGRRKR
jgi:hypothetical protein